MARDKRPVVGKDGKYTIDGRTMSKATYLKLYGNIVKSPSEMYKDVKKVSTTADAAKAAYDKKASKKAAKTVKKVTTLSKKNARKSLDMSSDTARARKAAADRAKSVPKDKRTPAQKRAIKSEIRYKVGFAGWNKVRGSGGTPGDIPPRRGGGMGGMGGVWNPKNR